MNFKIALVISFVGHCFILAPVGHFWFFPMHKKTENLPITYYKILPPKIEAEKKVVVEQKAPPETASAALEKPKAQKLDIVKKIKRVKPQPLQLKPPDVKPQEKILLPKENIIPSSIPGTTLPNTLEGTRYYQYIKRMILAFFEKKYPRNYEEGIVSISFVINNTGELCDFSIIEEKSSSNPVLRRICREGIRDASPFKPFPKNLSLKQYTFGFAVIFKQE